MKIGVMGYYGYGNAGDEVILRNLKQILAGYQVIPLPLGLNYSSDTIERLNDFDFLILGGGGLIQGEPPSPFGTFHLWHRSLQTPVGVLGVGVERLEHQFREPMSALLEEAAFFVVRDEQSRQILTHPKVTVLPDLTFYRPFSPQQTSEAIQASTGDILGVNLRPANSKVAHWVEAVNSLSHSVETIAFSTHPALGDQDILLRVNAARHLVFNEEAFGQLNYLVCTAFHALVFAIQMGIPAVAINYGSKVGRLMTEIGLEPYLLGWDDYDRLDSSLERLVEERRSIRVKMLEYSRRAQASLEEGLSEPLQIIASAQDKRKAAPFEVSAGGPRVSLIISARGASSDELWRTVDSCLAQDYANLEIIVIGEVPEPSNRAAEDSQRLSVVSDELWTADRARIARGRFFGFIEPGSLLANDAVRLMIRKLQGSPGATQCITSYYLTRDDIIERKVLLHRAADPDRPLRYSPWYLVHRREAENLNNSLSSNPSLKPPADKCVYCETTLFYQPASLAQLALYRGLLAFSRGEIEIGRVHFNSAMAFSEDRTWTLAPDLIDLIARTASNAPAVNCPLDFVELIKQSLPVDKSRLEPLLKKVKAHLRMTAFFETYASRSWSDLAHTALASIWDDPAWFRNRGMWAILFRALMNSDSGKRVPIPRRLL